MVANSTKNPTDEMRPEIQLLLWCARTNIDFEKAEQIKILLQENIDWDYLIRIARWHGFMPLLYSSLNSICPQAVPNAQLVQLRSYFHTNAQRSLFLTSELLKVLNLLQTHEISAIPYKGAVLAAFAYGNLSLRQFCDLDILIHPRDILRTQNLLISQGYQLHRQLDWEQHFLHQDSKVNVDLHWGITQKERPFEVDFEGLWSRIEPISLAGTKVVNLGAEDLLLILCVQITKDYWQWREQLAKICDIAELLRVHPSMDWNFIINQARKLGSERMLILGLLLVQKLLGTDLPKEILPRLEAHPIVEALANQVCERLLCKDYTFGLDDRPPKYLDREKNLFYFRVRERLQDKVPYFLHLVQVAIAPTEQDRAFLPIPGSLSFLYYLIRPIRAVTQYAFSFQKTERAEERGTRRLGD